MQHKMSTHSLLELKQALQKVYQSIGISTINLKNLGISNSQVDSANLSEDGVSN